ncbi:MAG: PilW family protein [Hydrogenophaga sp.]|uniref:PilW family protein n=1 Tax=Hydrogenophaga sp. TaxID=1904254 RepID=UPI00260160DB|nr:PilW family protein [Hydrogenophaga sp.]MDD3786645.1 PilW family protein [Hydrogenophaga sp.]
MKPAYALPIRRRRAASRGISLVELLVGITVSMLTVLAITQVFLASEEQRRVPSSLATTQVNAILALDAIQRDIQQAGYGLGGGEWLGCTTGTSAHASSKGLSGLTLAPVQIEAGDAANPSDRLTILYSGKVGPALPMQLAEDHDDSATPPYFTVTSNVGVRRQDWFVVATPDGSACDTFQAMDPDNPVANPIAAAGIEKWTIRHLPDDKPLAPNGDPQPTLPSESRLLNLGENPVFHQWSVAGNDQQFSLQVTDLATPAPVGGGARPAADAYPDIVLMRAFYGKDTDADGVIDTYDTEAPAVGDWGQVLGVRLAIVARSTERVKGDDPVTPEPLVWNLGDADVPDAEACDADADSNCLELSLEHTVPAGSDEWQFYRYRLFDTMVPLRNLIWNASPSS